MTPEFQKFTDARSREINTIAQRLSAFKIDSVAIGFEEARRRVIEWLYNFYKIGFKPLKQVLSMLEQMDFIQSGDIADNLGRISKDFLRNADAYIAPLGEDSESSFRIAANFNQHARYFSSLEELLNAMPGGSNNKILLFDDFLNSGGQVITIFKSLLGIDFLPGEINDEGDKRLVLDETQKQKLLAAEIHLFYYKAFDKGAEYVEIKNNDALKLKIKIHRYTSADKTDGLFGDEEDVAGIEHGLHRIITHGVFQGQVSSKVTPLYKALKSVGYELLNANEQLKPHEQRWTADKLLKRSLGYGNEARIIITDFNVPTNTITSLWMSGNVFVRGRNVEWNALLPRRKKVLIEKHSTVFLEPVQINGHHKQNDFMPGFDYLEEFNAYTKKFFLKKNLIYDFKNKALFETYTGLFLEIGSTSFNEIKGSTIDLFEKLLDIFEREKHLNPIVISGKPGSGRTLFMSLLYSYLYDNFKAGHFSKVPIYINLDYFIKTVYKEQHIDFQKKAQEELKVITQKASEIRQQFPGKELIVLIDGIDQYENPKVNIVNDVYYQVSRGVVQSVAGIKKVEDIINYKDRPQVNIPFESEPLFRLEFGDISSSDNNFNSVIELFAFALSEVDEIRAKALAEHLKKKIDEFRIKKFDLLILQVLSESFYNKYNYQLANNFSSYLEVYFSLRNVKPPKAGLLAHKTFNYRDNLTTEEKNSLEWWYIYKNETFRDYFIAKYVVEELLKTEPNNKTFNFVYPNEHNTFFKEIINRNRQSQKTALENIKKIIPLLTNKAQAAAKTHLCYLLGRFEDDTSKESARIFLHKLKDEIYEQLKQTIDFKSNQLLNRDQKKDLLLHRTILISLIYIGDTDTSSSYIEQLRENKYFCNLNRGFHLEYYGDIQFDPSDDDSLKHEDNFGNYCKSFNTLYSRVSDGVARKLKYPMFEVELYTLVSLAQHRQVSSNLITGEQEKRAKIISLLEVLFDSVIDISQPLKEYLDFVKDILARHEKITEAHLVADIFQIKKVQRIGWVKSHVERPESVPDHIYGTYLLAKYYLPEKLDDNKGYNKDVIIKLLLDHDLPEWYKGDIDASLKTENEMIEEENVARKMSLLGTYHNIANVSTSWQHYYDFTHSQDINCRIARDIDRLEMLQQLALYSKSGDLEKISDTEFKKLKSYSTDVKTDIGRKVREKILLLFNK